MWRCKAALRDLLHRKDFENALPVIHTALTWYPNDAELLHTLGAIYDDGGKFGFSYQLFRRALQEDPKNPVVWTALGHAAHQMQRNDEAVNCYMKAAELDNGYALAYSNGAATLIEMSQWEDGKKSAEIALTIDKDDPNAHMNMAYAHLALGDWTDGWKAFSLSLGGPWRREWTYGDETRWDGSEGKNLVIYGEQGLGDEIMFASCAPDAIKRSKKVYLDCDPKLEGLFKRSFPEAEVHGTRKEPSPEWVRNAVIDARASAGSVPEFCRNKDSDFPGTPYLVADPERRLMWRALFDSWGGKVIGIATKGGIKRTNAAGRNVPWALWEPVLSKKGYHFIDLDYAPQDETDPRVHRFPFATQSQDYDDTAALLAELDLVVGVGTTALHCSAALGVRTICLVSKTHMWPFARPRNPWYSCMRQMSQRGDWKQTLQELVLF